MKHLTRPDGTRLAYRHRDGNTPAFVYLHGFGGDMDGVKASFVADEAERRGHAFLRFDFSGHGASGGRFEDGTVSQWRDEALLMIDRLVDGPMILVGASMGGWIAMLLALLLPARVVGVIGLAAAPDFTERRVWETLSASHRRALLRDGHTVVPDRAGRDFHISRRLIEDGRRNALMGDRIDITCPVRLIQGQRDPEVPWDLAGQIASLIRSENVLVALIKDGDHQLSRPSDLRILFGMIADLLAENGA